MVAQHEVLAGGKSDRYLAKKGLIYGYIQTFIIFWGGKNSSRLREHFFAIFSPVIVS